MINIFNNSMNVLNMARLYPVSLYKGFKNRKFFNDVETYCMFIGYPRSGHSIVGALLDAHPNIVIAHELGVLKYILGRFSRNQIYYILLQNSQLHSKTGRKSSGYSYEVKNQWQGRFKELKIIGDNQGGGAVLRLDARPWLYQELCNTVKVKRKFIHVIRNPFDNITTIFRKEKKYNRNPHLMDSINFYFSLCETVKYLKKQIKSTEIHELRHESFVESPRTSLKELCAFLGVDASDDYLNDCANIVFKTPKKSRYDIKWDHNLIDLVSGKMEKFQFFEGYSFEE